MAVKIYDTTLRDGTQGEGISFSVDDKLKIAGRLVQMGFHWVEGGWPGSNPKDMEFFQRAREQEWARSHLTAFSSTCRVGQRPETDVIIQALLEAGTYWVTVFGKSWDLHVTEALNTTLEENLRIIRETIAYLVQQGRQVIFDAEHFFDGYKANPDYARAVLAAARDGGASWLVLCDTNGGSLPWEVQEITRQIGQEFALPLGIHCHNDGELAVANSLAAVQGGATMVQGTINGFGERCGNANLCSILPNLTFKMAAETIPREQLAHLTELSRYVSELANLHHPNNLPFVGKSAFAHKGGIHVSAILKNPGTYEHLNPELVGNERRVLVSELSGASNIVYKAEELGLDLDNISAEARAILQEIKELEHQGFQFEGAEGTLELMLRRAFENYQYPFNLVAFRVINEKREGESFHSEAVIKLQVGDEIIHTAAEGNGPVNALDRCLRKALEGVYPVIREMQLSDYKVRVLNEKAGTEANVRVLIETTDGHDSWNTVGVSENIIEASWQALVDSLAYGLLKREKTSGSQE